MKFTKDYIYDDGGRSKYYRPKKTSNDCVVRSISIALNQDYKDTLVDLCDFTVLYGEPFNTKNTYEKLFNLRFNPILKYLYKLSSRLNTFYK